MTDVEYSRQRLQHLKRRAILPLITRAKDPNLPDLNNLQGDIVYLFPKKAENFIFFRISDVTSFKKALKSFKPTSSEDVKELLIKISDAKSSGQPEPIYAELYQIAFSRAGLDVLGVSQKTGDPRFDAGSMRGDKDFLGDQRQWDQVFDTEPLHGVITIAAHDDKSCETATDKMKRDFGSSIVIVSGVVQGRARPDKFKGHEHFGYMDGISQPAPRGLVAPHPGQIQVDPGVLIMGYPGDPALDRRPTWAKDGTILVFRKLEQDVIGFERYLTRNGSRWMEFVPEKYKATADLSDKEGAELFGARLIGRWKSGAPLARCPIRDDPIMAENAEENNDFDYTKSPDGKTTFNEPSNAYCPFTMHNRKTAPRNLKPYVDPKYLESGSIVRGGLPYGPEVEPSERDNYDPNDPSPRGLLFNCYMSSLDSGFIRQTKGYAGNDFFPITSLVPTKQGQDPIIGGPAAKGSIGYERPATLQLADDDNPSYKTGDQVSIKLVDPKDNFNTIEVTGFANVRPSTAAAPPGEPNPYFVTSRGGEYFFVPSVSTIKDLSDDGGTATKASLDVLFLLDATGSMQPYIDQVRDSIQELSSSLVSTTNWTNDALRFGLVTFNDHPLPLDQVTTSHPFSTDVNVLKSTLSTVVAQGGGDGPEAQCEALREALHADWHDNATKIAILITDSPPHGIGEDEDKFPGGCPIQNDPIRLSKRLAKNGIVLHVLACEPTLSLDYSTPLDFYRAITQSTGGRLFPLTDVKSLLDLILGGVLESAGIEKLVAKHKADIRRRATHGIDHSTITQELHAKLHSEGVNLCTFDVEDVYTPNETGDNNVEAWLKAESIGEHTLSQIQEVRGFRLKGPYRSGGGRASMKSHDQPVTIDHVKRAVTKSLLRSA
ncbi:hypothetical protein B0J17DRAFT_603542 [Rhizoctonia solani]|nr:hypothetical protein B0J17DRAFT_603542 [Rhizoctonia solani]